MTCNFGASCVVEGAVASCLCPEICLESYNPVCGSDGVDYSNECDLNAAACSQQKSVTVVFQGLCGKSSFKLEIYYKYMYIFYTDIFKWNI